MKLRAKGPSVNFVYNAELVRDGVIIGYVRKRTRRSDYRAYSGGVMVGRGRTKEELLADLRDHFGETA